VRSVNETESGLGGGFQQAGGAREDWNSAVALAGESGSVLVTPDVVVGKKNGAGFGCA
jgi:hypothetical protein